MFYKLFINTLIIILISLSISCSPNIKKTQEVKKIIPLEVLYADANKSFQNNDYTTAIKLYEKIEKDYSYTIWAPKALLMKSFIYYDTNNYVQSLTNLQKFKNRYPGNKDFVYAEYLIAICLFEQINFSSLSQENTELALKQFNKILNEYPNSIYAKDSLFKIDLINEQFASKEMYLARYYSKKEKWVPALLRLNNILIKYQNTVFIEEALHRLVEINYRIGNINSAKKYASILGYNYNNSDWYKKSYKIVEERNVNFEKSKNKTSLKDKLKQLIN